MNAKSSLYIISCAILSTLCAYPVVAQDYETLQIQNIWSQRANPSASRLFESSAAIIESLADLQSGKYFSPNDASQQWGAGASAKSIRNLDAFSMQGGFSFKNTQMYQACGSMSVYPGYFPIDIYEFTPGQKTLQHYNMYGAIAKDLTQNIIVGGSLYYDAINYSKRKDLRYTTYYMSMNTDLGILWHNDSFKAGLSYSYDRKTQTSTAEVLGISAAVYYAFIDKGDAYGVKDLWDNSSIHLKDSGVNGFPIKENAHSIGLQAGIGDMLYADMLLTYKTGQIGEKQKIWFNYLGYELASSIVYHLSAEKANHYIRLQYKLKRQDNIENILEDITQSGITTTYNYGGTQIYSRQLYIPSLKWTVISNSGLMVETMLFAMAQNSLSSSVYPYISSRKLYTYGTYLRAYYDLGRFRLGTLIMARNGSYEENDRIVSGSPSTQTKPVRETQYNAQMLDYRTSPFVLCMPSVRYTFSKGIYIEYCAGLAYSSGTRQLHNIKLGYKF